ncbi:MAG TPA: mycofactocin precursor MftA [Acidimicrobiales bacterium]|jgi:mycofactocin precursor|nr:mycofactocin precursor MftA [Acidimicrobiales bacterium]
MTDPTKDDEAPPRDEGRPEEPAVELLVEEVSIDGLCGVY